LTDCFPPSAGAGLVSSIGPFSFSSLRNLNLTFFDSFLPQVRPLSFFFVVVLQMRRGLPAQFSVIGTFKIFFRPFFVSADPSFFVKPQPFLVGRGPRPFFLICPSQSHHLSCKCFHGPPFFEPKFNTFFLLHASGLPGMRGVLLTFALLEDGRSSSLPAFFKFSP